MDTKVIVELLENNDALGFTTFLKEYLATETSAQLSRPSEEVLQCVGAGEGGCGKAGCTEVTNHHKAAETAAAKAANVSGQSTATSAKDSSKPAKIVEGAETVVNKMKPEETAAGKAAGDATTQTTATSAKDGKGFMKKPETIKVMESLDESIKHHKDAASEADLGGLKDLAEMHREMVTKFEAKKAELSK